MVADRGMTSAETIAELEARGIASRFASSALHPGTRRRNHLLEVKEVVVGDSGLSSKPRRCGLLHEYILGARERRDTEVREIVLADSEPMVPLVSRGEGSHHRQSARETPAGR